MTTVVDIIVVKTLPGLNNLTKGNVVPPQGPR